MAHSQPKAAAVILLAPLVAVFSGGWGIAKRVASRGAAHLSPPGLPRGVAVKKSCAEGRLGGEVG